MLEWGERKERIRVKRKKEKYHKKKKNHTRKREWGKKVSEPFK